MFRHLSWHSFRVFIPDGAYQLGMPRDQRQYLGNWTTENIADIFTREKRKVVQRAWPEVADKLGNLDLTGGKTVPADLDHQHWQPEKYPILRRIGQLPFGKEEKMKYVSCHT
jgi:hypothetical protein